MKYCHYTNLDGLLGIISSKELWASSILFLNDRNEYIDTLKHLSGLIPKANIKKGNRDWVFYEDFEKALIELLDSLKGVWRKRNYSLSFSKEHDLLSQWRGYCPENNGYGIVFDAELIEEEVRKTHSFVYVGDCVYEDKEKIMMLRAKLNEGYFSYRDSIFENTKTDFEIEVLGQELDELACIFKDPSFMEEKERRIVISLDESEKIVTTRFKPGNGYLIPYVPVKFSDLAVKKIIIGPTFDPERAESSLHLFLQKNFEKDRPEIEHSIIPFRSW